VKAALLAVALALALPGVVLAADGPAYEEAPAPVASPDPGVGSAVVRFSGLRLDRRSGRALVFVSVSAPGRAIVHGRGVRRLVRIAGRAKRMRLPVKPKVRLQHYLKRHGKGRIRVEVTFKPLAGVPETIEKVVVLRRARHRARRG
jgi:hypothetical protein